jgi:diadenosine tetraphosphatase ApaH/serine/threonine PP2A family protein phosphatase
VRYAVLSDIHGNAEALAAVLGRAEEEGVDGYLCLGDVVGYGPDPARAIEAVRALKMVTVRGNHDDAAVDPAGARHFNAWARDAILWTRERLTEDELGFLDGLPYTARVDNVLLVHASPSAPAEWRYVLSSRAAVPEFDAFEQAVCLIGHSHSPMIVALAGSGAHELLTDETAIERGTRYLVNVGSVGQPRDGDPRAAYAILDLERMHVRIERTAYDADTTRRKILESGLPRFLGDRLLEGA